MDIYFYIVYTPIPTSPYGHQPREFWVQKVSPRKAGGGQTTKPSDIQIIFGLAGVVDSTFHITFILMDNKHLCNRKSLKPLRSSLRNKSTFAESVLWNQLKSNILEALSSLSYGLRTGLCFRNPKNQPPRPGKQNYRYFKINNPGHPSFKRRGNLYNYKPYNYDGLRY